MKSKVLTSLQHPLVKHLVKLKKSARYRSESGTVLIEGSNLVEEVTAEVPAKVVLTTGEEASYPAETVYCVTDAVLKKVAGTQTPEGVIAEVPIPQEAPLHGAKRLLVLDRIQDPGNMGTLMRTALAMGWDGAYLIDGCCDPCNDKAIRAAKGATFRLPWRRGGWEGLAALVQEGEMQCFAADLEGALPEEAAKGGKPFALVLGNEAQGLSDEAKRHCQRVTIPMSGAMESLNVSAAGAILMYVLKGMDNEG